MQATCCMTRNRPIATLFMTMVVKAPCAPADDRYNRPNIRTGSTGTACISSARYNSNTWLDTKGPLQAPLILKFADHKAWIPYRKSRSYIGSFRWKVWCVTKRATR